MKRKTIVFLALLLAGILLVLGNGFESAYLKTRLAEAVSANTQRRLTIDGPVRLVFLPRPTLTVGAARLSGSEGEGEFLRLDAFSGALEILPLLWGKVVIHQLAIDGLDIQAVRHADGRSNFDDLLALQGGETSSPDLEIKKITLTGGRFSWQDDENGRLLVLEDLRLATGALGRKTQGALEIGGILRVDGENLTATWALESRYRLDERSLRFEAPRLLLEGKGEGVEAFHLELAAQQLHSAWEPLWLDLEALSLKGEFEAQDAPLDINLRLGKFYGNLTEGQAKDLELQLARTGHDLPFSFSARIEAVRGKEGEWRSEQEGLIAKGEGVWEAHQLSGALEAPFVVSFAKERRLTITKMTGAIKSTPGKRLLRPLELRLRGKLEADLETRQADGSLDAQWDESQLEASWRLEPSRLDFQAHLNQLNLDQYLENDAKSDEEPPPSTEPERADAARANDEDFTVAGRLSIDRLQVGGAELTHVSSDISVSRGDLVSEIQSP